MTVTCPVLTPSLLLPFTVDDLRALEGEGLRGVRFRLHLVQLGEDGVVEEAVGLEVEL